MKASELNQKLREIIAATMPAPYAPLTDPYQIENNDDNLVEAGYGILVGEFSNQSETSTALEWVGNYTARLTLGEIVQKRDIDRKEIVIDNLLDSIDTLKIALKSGLMGRALVFFDGVSAPSYIDSGKTSYFYVDLNFRAIFTEYLANVC